MKLAYKPFGIILSIVGGLVASRIFDLLWTKAKRGELPPPKPTEADRAWSEVLLAAALHGAVFSGVKALVNRAGAAGFQHSTGVWPGPDRQEATD